MTIRLRAFDDILAKEPDWIWRGMIPRGGLTLLEGDPGNFKSSILYDVAARLSSGRPMPEASDTPLRGNVWLVSCEDSATRIQSTLVADGADLKRIQLLESGNGLAIHFPTELGDLEAVLRGNPPVLIALDPIADCVDGAATSERCVRAAIGPLCKLAIQHNIAVVGVRHLTKSRSRNPLYHGGGSIAFAALARSVLVAAEHPFEDGQRVLVQIKSSLGPRSPIQQFQPIPIENGLAIDWRGVADLSFDQLVAAQSAVAA